MICILIIFFKIEAIVVVDCGVTVIQAWCHYDTSWCRYGVIVTPLGVQLTPAKGVQLAQTLGTPFFTLRFYSLEYLQDQLSLHPAQEVTEDTV